jgi:adenylosuccinate synthase
MTKLDVLTGINPLQVATHYILDGRKLEGQMPPTLEELERCEVVYQTLDGWD